MRLDRIAELAECYHAAESDAQVARERLYHAIRSERRRADGASLRVLAGRTGLSFARIAQIASQPAKKAQP
jgi:hypothetical protein